MLKGQSRMELNGKFPESDFYNSVGAIRDLLEQQGLVMQKRFGQNFLVNQNVREKIVESIDLNPDSVVWEVGPGIGAITALIVGKCRSLHLFEIDRGFIELLKQLSSELEHVEVVPGDALKNWPALYETQGVPDAVVGNLPYNVGSVIIASFIEKGLLPQRMTFTVQKEVALRLEASSGSKIYSSFTMLTSLDYKVKRVMDISPGSFYPRPDVISSIIVMDKKKERMMEGYSLDDPEIRSCYFRLIRDLFKSRRKTIRNNLIKSGELSTLERETAEAICVESGIDPTDRGERLDISTVWRLAGRLCQL